MKLIKDCRAAFKHYSTKALAMLTGLGTTWAAIPDEVRYGLPGWATQTVYWLIAGVAILGLGGKFIDQGTKDGERK